MRHCGEVLVFMIGMLLCVIIAVVVILLIASPSFREGERILTPEGEERVQNVKRRAASVAARAEQETSRSAGAVKAAVRNRRRSEEDVPAEPTPDGNSEASGSIPVDGDVVEDRTINLAKMEAESGDAETELEPPVKNSEPAVKNFEPTPEKPKSEPVESETPVEDSEPAVKKSETPVEKPQPTLEKTKSEPVKSEPMVEKPVPTAETPKAEATKTQPRPQSQVDMESPSKATPTQESASQQAQPTVVVPMTKAQSSSAVDSSPAPAASAARVSTGSSPYRPVATAATMQNQPAKQDTSDRLWVDEDDELDDDVPEHFESPTPVKGTEVVGGRRETQEQVAATVVDDAPDSQQVFRADDAPEGQDGLGADDAEIEEDEPVDGGFFSRITDSLNRSSADRSRTGPRHSRT